MDELEFLVLIYAKLKKRILGIMLVWIHCSDGLVKAPIIKFTYKFTEFTYASVNHYYEEVSVLYTEKNKVIFLLLVLKAI